MLKRLFMMVFYYRFISSPNIVNIDVHRCDSLRTLMVIAKQEILCISTQLHQSPVTRQWRECQHH